MKKTVILLVFVLSFVQANAQLSVFSRFSEGGEICHTVSIFGTKNFSDNYSFAYFTLVSQEWSETLLGVAYTPNNWSQFGLLSGFAQESDYVRVGGFIWLGNEKFSGIALAVKSMGVDDLWYRAKALYHLNERSTIGVQAWRWNGIGPLFEYRIEKLHSIVWIFPAYEFEFDQKAISIGIEVAI